MTALRLIADDLTGALDTAAEFVGLVGPVPVYWSGAIPLDLPPSAALDSGTRELGEREAVTRTAQLAKGLVDAKIAYKKVDSLLRGHVVAELIACLRGGAFRYCVLAPAFPYQGRVMRDGVQWRRTASGEWSAIADIRALLVRAGLPAALGKAGETLKPGITVYDAEKDDDLRPVAKLGATTDGPVLWCGSAGLAQALAGERKAPSMAALRRPVLGLFGSDQAITVSQLESCGPYHLRLSDGGPDNAAYLEHLLRKTGVAMASLDLPSGLGRGEAAQWIGSELARLTREVPRPGTLVVAGGETLRGLCAALEATTLAVQGQIEPGLPYSRLRGGRWDGVEVVSKSGAFGRPEIWRDLLHLDRANAPRAQR
jgi:D-threonate/D-erythronate kinase